MLRTVVLKTSTHGRALVEDAAVAASDRVLVGCHGYGQNAALMMDELRRLPGASAWRLVAVQALHRFYARGHEAVVAGWMTREDREHAIADNIEYLDRVVDTVAGDAPARIVLLGFSQGASMAARAAVRGARRAAGLILLGGDIPPDVREIDEAGRWPPTLVGCGDDDAWYGGRVDADLACLRARGVPHEVVRFAGGHEFTDEFREAAGRWLERVT